MTTVIACLVCASPLDGLLTSGLHAGVLTMALVVAGVQIDDVACTDKTIPDFPGRWSALVEG